MGPLDQKVPDALAATYAVVWAAAWAAAWVAVWAVALGKA